MGVIGFIRRLRCAGTADGAQDSGAWGESRAEEFLRALDGWRILGRRVRPDRRDEIDLVARDGDVLVFVEVKTRKGEAFGRPIAAVDRAKRRTLSRAAVRYLVKHRLRRINFRFDVVEVVGAPGGKVPEIRHVRDAFKLDSRYMPPV